MTDNEKKEVKEVIEASNEMKYLGMICSLRADGYNRPQCQCGIMALPNDMDFDIKKVLALIKENIGVINKALSCISLLAKKSTLTTCNNAISEIIKIQESIIKNFPDVVSCDIFCKLTAIMADPNTNNYQKCFRIWQAIENNYFLDSKELN